MNHSTSENVRILTKKDFPMSNQNIHIEMSNEFPDYIGVPHKHKFIEVVYVISGSATHEIDDNTYRAKQGDLFIINMDTTHVFRCEQNAAEPFVAYDLKFTPEFFDSSVTGYRALEALNNSFMFYSLVHGRKEYTPYVSVTGNSFSELGELFHKIYQEYRGQEKGYIEIIRAYLMQLIITIFRSDAASSKNVETAKEKQVVNYMIDYIKTNFASHISTGVLAEQVYMNKDYLGRVFREQTGMTISEMIQKVRIERACEMLENTNRTITNIALTCGFDDVKFFYTIFKRQMGVRPGDYRKHKTK